MHPRGACRYNTAMQLYLFSGGGAAILSTMAQRCAAAVAGVTQPVIAYIPAASVQPPAYWLDLWTAAFAAVGSLRLIDLDTSDATGFAADLAGCAAVLVPGGNTYLPARRMHRLPQTIPTLVAAVRGGLPLITRSAGTVFSGPNMLTTNDWNVFGTTQFSGLGLSPYNFNVHFTLPPPDEAESRDFRIREYVAVNGNPVLALEERCNLAWTDGEVQVHDGRAWRYTPDGDRQLLPPGSRFTV
ncbi:MAG: Type 1 glutamine amidotransferase-like domain-containing protein [Chloroflexota bacterium]|nr:Type 1 glutamine amidotransferase-like domain-containing protein [Chloroflexota bacterium]